MRKRFTRAFSAVSAAALITAGLGLSAGIASASTEGPKDTVACGANCVSIFSDTLGSGVTMNAFVHGDTGVGGRVGTPVNMHIAGNFRPNGDFTPSISGFVFQFCGFLANDFFSPTSFVCRHYPLFAVIELNWSAFGNQSGFCAGVSRATAGRMVTLQPCGATAKTVWIADRIHSTQGTSCLIAATPPVSPGDSSVNFCPLINGGDRNFSQPLVLTLDTGTKHPANQLKLGRELLVGNIARSNQQFAFFFGPVS
ncbi:MAG TPA: hypothetical protein VFQ44_04010 [Streptosporangiaceae bacterium]|nr:hypothetical protein [Streptosporangiaceae bacterium]